MATTVIKKRKFDKNFNKKNSEKGQLLLDFSHHQTWPPPLLKIEHLTKKMQKLY